MPLRFAAMARSSAHRAVLFADVSDSAALYQKLGDDGARRVVNSCLQALAGTLPRHEGNLIKTLGDGVMCVFDTADAAVRAAAEMQAVVTESRPGDQRVAIHVGLHYGPVLLEEGDIFGDTVNVAAYLAAVAMRDQILTTEATHAALTPVLKSCVRPVFRALLKGSPDESTVYQVLWETEDMEITDVNLHATRIIPADTGSLRIELGSRSIQLDQRHPLLRVGRAPESDLVVDDRYASRHHLSIRLSRTRFYLSDHSINGTYVTMNGNEEVHVLRSELPLEGSGEIRIGRSRSQGTAQTIRFSRDRRAIYRV
jgi:adenylate cyclase